jgi:hypothetical protein
MDRRPSGRAVAAGLSTCWATALPAPAPQNGQAPRRPHLRLDLDEKAGRRVVGQDPLADNNCFNTVVLLFLRNLPLANEHSAMHFAMIMSSAPVSVASPVLMLLILMIRGTC